MYGTLHESRSLASLSGILGRSVKYGMPDNYILSFVKGISVDRLSEDHIAIQSQDRRFHLKSLTAGLRRAILLLSSSGATEDELARITLESDGDSSIARFYFYLRIFTEHRMIQNCVQCNGQPLATLTPISSHFQFSPEEINPRAAYELSEFAYLHKKKGQWVLESPLSHGKITLHRWHGAALVAELADPRSFQSLCALLPDLSEETVRLLLEMLLGANFILEHNTGAPYPEGEILAQWDFHDLLFHARSRMGRHANPYGGTYRFQEKLKPLPAVKPTKEAETIELYKPDMAKLEQEDYPFSLVLEHRRSIREYAKSPITDRQLGEFLYRTARLKESINSNVQELSARPYPGGGAIYELELYLTVNACQGIPSGLYHYCPKNHLLCRISDPNENTEALLKDAVYSTGQEGQPQVLVTIAARFQRLSWKYESMAYNVILKNVGVLYQTMYLVATAMDLAPCALGGGDSDLFARAAGLDYYAETSVGEFLLGSKRTGPNTA